jgi:glyoxylase-like metal-dependent hydrolase (beta-lactamase superfamily II)
MPALAAGLDYLDLNFQGHAEIIATAVLHGPAGVALVDPGPSTTMATLTAALEARGIRFSDVRQLLLTHIHLDHAGATGSITGKHPHIEVLVHERGARHLVDPSKLVASAERIYAADMDRLWGEILPVAASRIRSLSGGETISVVGRELKVEYTPGHASHHVSYLDSASHIAFVGDTAGIRRGSGTFVMPPTPPPDIDLEAWDNSIARIGRWRPSTLFITHFGPHAPVGPHLTELADHLRLTSGLAKASLAREGSDEAREVWFADEIRRELRRRMSESDAHAYEVAGRFDLSWRGLARYWRKKVAGG